VIWIFDKEEVFIYKKLINMYENVVYSIKYFMFEVIVYKAFN
jgi:hypothetical protein